MNMRSIKVCISNHATVFREHVPTLTFYFQAFWTLLTVTFWLALHGHHATIRRSWSLNPWKPFRSGLGMGKARWCSVFNLVFRLVDQKALRPTLGMISLSFIFIYGLYIYIFFFLGKTQNGHIPKIEVICWSKQNQRLFQRFLIWRFQQFEAPLGDLPKRLRCHVEHFDDQRIGLQSSTRQTFIRIFYDCILVRASKTSGIMAFVWKFYSIGIGPWKKTYQPHPRLWGFGWFVGMILGAQAFHQPSTPMEN